jgi:hypothetical protein
MANIPIMDFRGVKFVNDDGSLTDVAQAFFDSLQSILVRNFGEEGLVSPSQSASNITTIQNNQEEGPTGILSHTCKFGTFIYDSSNNKGKICLDDGSGNPIFKEILTA